MSSIQKADEAAAEICALIVKAESVIEIKLPDSQDELFQLASSSLNEAAKHYVIAGLSYLKIKSNMDHGQFKPELDRRGIPYATANRAMNVVKMLGELPKEKIATLQLLGSSKLSELAKLDIDDVADMSDEQIDEFDKMSVRQLKEVVRDSKVHEKKLEADKAQLAETVDDLVEDLDQKNNGPQFKHNHPALVAHIRKEAFAASEVAYTAINDINDLFEQLTAAQEFKADEKLDTALTLKHLISAPLARLSLLNELLNSRFNIANETVVEEIPSISVAEWQELDEYRQVSLSRYASNKLLRA